MNYKNLFTQKTFYSQAELQAKVDTQPRLSLAFLPTPLEFCPRLSKLLGGPDIFIKRDDLTGLAFGGNKTRQLEFLLPKVLNEDFDICIYFRFLDMRCLRRNRPHAQSRVVFDDPHSSALITHTVQS